MLKRFAFIALTSLLCVSAANAWGPDGHMWINRAAAMSMPADYPAFMKTTAAIAELEWLGPEPDRWRSTSEPSLKNAQEPDHFLDMELLADFGPLPIKRYDYIKQLAEYQRAQLAKGDPEAQWLTPDHVGTQPWETAEVWERLLVAFREYRNLQKAHKPTAPAEAAAIYYAGWLGHYVADASNPMHTTIQYNGWVGANPNGYTTSHTIHSEFESVFVHDNLKPEDIRIKAPTLIFAPTGNGAAQPEWDDYLAYMKHSNSLVEPLYQLEKTGAFKGAGTAAGHQFVIARLDEGAQRLADLWYTAWMQSAIPAPEYHAEKAAAAARTKN